MEANDKTATITFRTTEKLKSELELMAKKDGRNLSNMIERILQLAVDANKQK